MHRILIVDDRSEDLRLLRSLLEGRGWQVEEASHGDEALVKARQSPPHLIISDLLMPVMDGYTLLRQWRTDERLKKIPFVVYTATYTEPQDERLALEFGADDFFIKPAEPKPFMIRIENVLMKARDAERLSTKTPASVEKTTLKEYSEELIRKLEEKALQLDRVNRTLEQDIAASKETEAILNSLVAGTAAVGDEFFPSLVREMTIALQVRYVFVGELLPGNPDRVRSIAVWAGSGPGENFEYDLAGTPCAKVISQSVCYYPAGVQKEFPADHLLSEMEVEGYLGTPLLAADGQPLGLLVALHDRPLDLPQQAKDLLRVFASRAAAELERLKSLQALRESEARYREFMTGLPVAAYITDTTGRITLYNEAAVALWGRRPEKGDLWCGSHRLYTADGMLLPHEQCPAAVAIRENRSFKDYEAIAEQADGTRVNFLANITPITDGSGRVLGVTNVILDITERRRVEDTLRESEQRFRRLIEHAPEAITLLDVATGKFTLVNGAAERLFRIPAQELGKFGPAEMSPPQQPDGQLSSTQATEFVARALAGETPCFDWTHRNAEGRDIPCEVRLLRLEINGREVVRGSITDISERHHAEQALRSSEGRYRRLVESNLIGFIIAGTDGRVVEANEYFLNMLGLTRQELDAGVLRWDTITPPEWNEADQRAVKELEATGVTAPFEKEYFHKDGHRVPILATVALLEGTRGEGVCLIADMTEHKRAGEKIRAQLEELRRWQNVIHGREERIMALKAEVNELLAAQGKPDRYSRDS